MASPKSKTQAALFPQFDWKSAKAFVGPAKGNPRHARPIATKRFMHLILKSGHMGAASEHMGLRRSFFRQGRALEKLVMHCGRQSFVEVKELAFAHDHIHMLIKPKSVRAYKTFIRALSGLIARKVLGVERGPARDAERDSPAKLARFWQTRPFTRIVEWGRDLVGVKNYLMKNRLDLVGMPRQIAHEMFRAVAALAPPGVF